MHPKYQEAIELRFKGESYGEIAKLLGVAKSSVSLWCRDLKLPQSIQRILDGKLRNTRANLESYNKKR